MDRSIPYCRGPSPSLYYQYFIVIRLCIKLLYPLFSLDKKGILISYRTRLVRASVTLFVNVSPPKLLDVATSNFVAEQVT